MTTPNRGRKRRPRPRSGGRVARSMPGAMVEIGRAIAVAADAVGRLELRIAAMGGRPSRATARRAAAVLRGVERTVTPPRAVAAVVLCAAVVLGISQFVDYRGVRIGAQLYEGVEAVAPAPQTAREPAGSAHAYVLLPVAALAVLAAALALRGRWQLGRAVSLLGLVGVVITLVVDRPAGLEEGVAARNFEGAEAVLVEGFWVQLAASAVLVVAGALLSRYARTNARDVRARRAEDQARGVRAHRAAGGGMRRHRPASGDLA